MSTSTKTCRGDFCRLVAPGVGTAYRPAPEADKAMQRAAERKAKRLKELEVEIANGEAELERRREELRGDPGGDWAKLADLAKQERQLAQRVEAAMAEWVALGEELAGQDSLGGSA